MRSLLIFLLFGFGALYAQVHHLEDQVILVQLELNDKLMQPSMWSSYDIENRRIMLDLGNDDPLAAIDEIGDLDDPAENIDCFVPNLKLIYKDHTYLISSLCAKVKKFQNDKPFVMGSQEIPTDVEYTSSLSQYLEKIQAIYFGPTYQKEYSVFAQQKYDLVKKSVDKQFSTMEEEQESQDDSMDIEKEDDIETGDEQDDLEQNDSDDMEDDIEEEDFDEDDFLDEKPKKKR